ncbi:MAG TPA: DUF268 domain-containing protein [Patescibacteria group bacterium]
MKSLIKKTRDFILSPFVFVSYLKYRSREKRFSVPVSEIKPYIFDKLIATNFDRHYVYHTSWAARKLKQINPEFHADISSSLYFAGIASAFVPVKFFDYRPADIVFEGLQSDRADLMQLPFANDSIKSLSCMHVVEHIGLGRYGDSLDSEGDKKAAHELKRVLASGGSLLFVVPVGKPRIQFNAHRIYSYDMVMELFEGLELKEFVLIPERSGAPLKNVSAEQVRKENYGCGCFWFIKK